MIQKKRTFSLDSESLWITSLRERLRTHKVFTKDQCFTLIIISSP